jgi:hypothetical protein
MNDEVQKAIRGGDRLSEPMGSGYIGQDAEARDCNKQAGGSMRSTMTFGAALEAVKNGRRIARLGWNGSGVFVYLNEGSDPAPPQDRARLLGGIPSRLFRCGDVGTIRRLPNLNMRAADGATVTGWLASQTDMLAEDWVSV